MNNATVLVVGGGGREHALAWSLCRSDQVGRVYVAPGNGGTASLPRTENVVLADDDAILDFVASQQITLVVVGPEVPLARGLADRVRASGTACFGPSALAARIESSKAWSKAFMDRHDIPTAAYGTFTDVGSALAYLDTVDHRVVVKASGLAAGKGVLLPETLDEARDAVRSLMSGRFGDAGDSVVIEERLEGWELSVFALTDGQDLVLAPVAQDHKRLLDGNLGPNTGGMGAYAPAPQVDASIIEAARRQVIEPAIAGMREDGCPFVGVLYAGLMMTPGGLQTLEFNCRFGDPETQVLLPLLASDFYALAMACATGTLANHQPVWHEGLSAVTVVAASAGYPESGPRGVPITGCAKLDGSETARVFHAGTQLEGETLRTAGGRVLAVTGLGVNLADARAQAYAGMALIGFEGMQVRSDIGAAAGSGLELSST